MDYSVPRTTKPLREKKAAIEASEGVNLDFMHSGGTEEPDTGFFLRPIIFTSDLTDAHSKQNGDNFSSQKPPDACHNRNGW
jgi:hypothetical protein